MLVEGESAKLLGPARRSEEVTWEGARLVRKLSDGGACEIAVGAQLDELMAHGEAGGDVSALFDVAPLMSDEGQEERLVREGEADQLKSG